MQLNTFLTHSMFDVEIKLNYIHAFLKLSTYQTIISADILLLEIIYSNKIWSLYIRA